jgi:shikimate kinase
VIPDNQHLVLVGMMGVGKTTVGRIVGERLGRRVVDSDQVIEARTGRTVREIFASDGEPAFRALETEAMIEALTEQEPLVIAAAGGVVLSEQNRSALRDSPSKVVWLCADPATLADRVRSGGHRPLLDDDPEGVLQKMFAERTPLYRQVADAIVLVDGRSITDVVDAVLR